MAYNKNQESNLYVSHLMGREDLANPIDCSFLLTSWKSMKKNRLEPFPPSLEFKLIMFHLFLGERWSNNSQSWSLRIESSIEYTKKKKTKTPDIWYLCLWMRSQIQRQFHKISYNQNPSFFQSSFSIYFYIISLIIHVLREAICCADCWHVHFYKIN